MRLIETKDFFQKDIKFWKIRVPKRFLLPISIVIIAKLLGAAYIYYSTGISTMGTFWSDPSTVFSRPQNNVFLIDPGSEVRWPLTFLGWDSAWYLSIMTKGYDFSPQSFTFSPGFPFFGKFVNLGLQDPMISLVLTALVFGVLWIPLYQLFAEEYLDEKQALLSSLLLAFSPYLFVFTTVAYSEGLLLFFVLGSLILFKKNKLFGASVFAIIAPLARITGILIVFPMIYYSLKKKTYRIRNIIVSLLPVVSLVGWWVCLGFFYGDFLAPVHTTEWSSMYSFRSLLLEVLPNEGINGVVQAVFQSPVLTFDWFLSFAVPIALIFPFFVFKPLCKKDVSLWIYAVAGYCGILFFGAIVSMPRFISVLFPLWIPLTSKLFFDKKRIVFFVCVLILCYVISLYLWESFLNGRFIA